MIADTPRRCQVISRISTDYMGLTSPIVNKDVFQVPVLS